jgi:hypothetical protein
MSTNSPEEAHEETETSSPGQTQGPIIENDPGEHSKKDAAEPESSPEAIGVRAES